MCNTSKTLLLTTAVLLSIQERFKSQQDITAYDITSELRDKANAGEFAFLDLSPANIGGINTYRIENSTVRELVKDLYANELLPREYIRDYASNRGGASYTVYRYNGGSNGTNVTSAGSAPITGVIAQPALPAPAIHVVAQGQTSDVEAKIKTYIENKLAVFQTPTLKSIQSRLKNVPITCAEIEKIVLNLGFHVGSNSQRPSLALVTQ